MFQVGQQVLIVGGVDAFHRVYIGKASAIEFGPERGMYASDSGLIIYEDLWGLDGITRPCPIHGAGCWELMYRTQDLMPLDGDFLHEVTDEQKEKEKAEVIR